MSRKGRAAIRIVAQAEPPPPDLEARIAALTAELDEAREQQTATADILRAIAAAPGDAEGTLRKIAETTARLFRAVGASFRLAEGDEFTVAIGVGHGAEQVDAALYYAPDRPRPRVSARTVPSTVVRENRQIHLPDLDNLPADAADWPGPPILRAAGIRTLAATPLRREGQATGALLVYRDEVRPFADEELQLLQSFADQAVIAIENARLLAELHERTRALQEALEYQTATGEVLKVISRSTFDLQRVLETLAESAAALARSDTVFIFRREGDVVRLAAQHAPTPAFGAVIGSLTLGPDRGSTTGRVLLTGDVVNITNVQDEPGYTLRQSELDRIGSTMAAPLLREGEVIGVITLARLRVEPFTERQIELVRTFADQAVIAIENTRLITETREALEQQTATAEVLGVINSSPGNVTPVFEAILDKAHALCGAERGTLFLYDGSKMKAAVAHGYPADVIDHLRAGIEVAAAPRYAPLFTGNHVHIHDLSQSAGQTSRLVSGRGGVRTNLLVPLFRDGELLGMISCNRTEVRPFSDKEIALIENFAAQAVIAIENARLITETREALEQQTATAEVLGVINSSPGELEPVFDAMLEKAMMLCDAPFGGLFVPDGEVARYVALRNAPERWAEALTCKPPRLATMLGPAFLADPAPMQIPDLAATEGYRRRVPLVVAGVDLGGIRTVLFVPLLKEGALAGVFSIYRNQVHPFGGKEVALVENFAAQAVVAMDNARLLDEIRRRQAELRVTFDNMGDGVAMFDAEHRLAAWNRNFQQILDLPDELVAGRPTIEEYIRYLAVHGEYGDADVEGEVRRVVGAVAGPLSAERTRPDGRVIELRNDPVPGGGFVLIYRDVTERKRSEADIRAARDAAEGALRELKLAQANLIQAEKMASLGQLTAGIAHEIKNPLNFVNNFATLSNELLDELKEVAAPGFEVLPEDARADVDETMAMLSGNLDKIAEHGRRADGIVKSMLAHSRGSSGERQSVDLNALAEEALNFAYHGARAQDQTFNIILERDFAAGLGPIEVAPQDVTRVLLNLIGNGFHAAHKRLKDAGDSGFRPQLKVATRELGDAVEVRVRDNGTGIPVDIRDKLFQPFFTTKPTGEGTGLGLSISYDIVTQQHGGTISVESEVGAYTEFTVRLPRHDGNGPGEARTVGRGA